MKIDWKHLATTKGYISLKATYVKAVQDSEKHSRRYKSYPMRDKTEYLKHFNWIISRAKHYAHLLDEPIEVILDGWEDKRNYCWLNYYQDCAQPRAHSNSLKPLGIAGIRKYYISMWGASDTQARKNRVSRYLCNEHEKNNTKSPKRWPSMKKKRYAKYR